jgi:hypothetical protein
MHCRVTYLDLLVLFKKLLKVLEIGFFILSLLKLDDRIPGFIRYSMLWFTTSIFMDDLLLV